MAVADTVDERSRTDTVPGVSGVWDVDLDSSYGALQLVLDLTQTGSSVTGTVSGSMFQPMAIEAGSVSGDRAQWQASVTEPMAMTLEFQVAFDGDSVTGNVKFGEFGDGTLSGTRRGSADAAAGSAEGVVSLQGRVSETLPPEAISMELLPVVEELGLVENCRQLAAEGWTVIENAADAEFFERLRNTILDTTPGSGSRGRLLDKEPVFAEAALNPSVMAMAEFSVGRGFLMGSLIATVRNAGDPCTPPHSDQDMFPAPFAEHNMMLTACWACDDFTKDGGATLVIPGTKRFRRHPNDAESADLSNAIAIECPAGSVALWDGSVWHGNWPRSIPGQRVVLHATLHGTNDDGSAATGGDWSMEGRRGWAGGAPVRSELASECRTGYGALLPSPHAARRRLFGRGRPPRGDLGTVDVPASRPRRLPLQEELRLREGLRHLHQDREQREDLRQVGAAGPEDSGA